MSNVWPVFGKNTSSLLTVEEVESQANSEFSLVFS